MEYVNPLADQPNSADYGFNLNKAPSYLQSAVAGENLERSAPFLDMARKGAESDLNKKLLENSEFSSPEATGQRSMQRQSETAKAKYERDIMPGKTVKEMAENEQAAKSAPMKGDLERAQLSNQLLEPENAPHAELLGRVAGLGEQWKNTPKITDAEKAAQWNALMQEHKMKWGDRATTDPTMSAYGPHVPTVVAGATGAMVHTAKHIQDMAKQESENKSREKTAGITASAGITEAQIRERASNYDVDQRSATARATLEADPKKELPTILERLGTDKERKGDQVKLNMHMQDIIRNDPEYAKNAEQIAKWSAISNNLAANPEERKAAEENEKRSTQQLDAIRDRIWKMVPEKFRPTKEGGGAAEMAWIERAKRDNPGMSESDIIANGKRLGKIK